MAQDTKHLEQTEHRKASPPTSAPRRRRPRARGAAARQPPAHSSGDGSDRRAAGPASRAEATDSEAAGPETSTALFDTTALFREAARAEEAARARSAPEVSRADPSSTATGPTGPEGVAVPAGSAGGPARADGATLRRSGELALPGQTDTSNAHLGGDLTRTARGLVPVEANPPADSASTGVLPAVTAGRGTGEAAPSPTVNQASNTAAGAQTVGPAGGAAAFGDAVRQAERDWERERGRRRVAHVVAGLIDWVGSLAAVVLCVYAVLTVAGANPDNAITVVTGSVAPLLGAPFTDLFTPKDPNLALLMNYVSAAAFWIIVTTLISRLIRKIWT